jgi:hypothetical protein
VDSKIVALLAKLNAAPELKVRFNLKKLPRIFTGSSARNLIAAALVE